MPPRGKGGSVHFSMTHPTNHLSLLRCTFQLTHYDQSGLNYFASARAAIENVLLAAANEGLACAFRIPICDEAEHVKQAVGAPKGYELACFLAIGHPAPDARRCRQKAIDVPSRIHHGSW